MTNPNDPIENLKIHGLVAIKSGLDAVSELAKANILEPWHLDLWQHLISEFGLVYKPLLASYDEKNIRASAWLARNLLELNIWLTYCVKSRDDAKRFYDDKARDMFDFLNHMEVLMKLPDRADLSMADLIDGTRKRILDWAETDGCEDIDETYQRVHTAAQELGLGAFFRSMNKMLSKFAHPTAMMVFSYPDEASRAQGCAFFLAVGMILCAVSMDEFDRYARAISARTE
jgi:hypothetical protein